MVAVFGRECKLVERRVKIERVVGVGQIGLVYGVANHRRPAWQHKRDKRLRVDFVDLTANGGGLVQVERALIRYWKLDILRLGLLFKTTIV